MDTWILFHSRTILDRALKALHMKMEDDIKAIPQPQGKWRIFHL